jgi:opacity protein-like surface antigen
MKRTLTTLVLATALAGSAFAQTAAVGVPDAKGNAAIKAPHTVNDGAAKAGRNSFTQRQAMQHIRKSGFTNVSALTKGSDGVWRGKAMKNGMAVDVAMDFKGNVTEGTAAGSM